MSIPCGTPVIDWFNQDGTNVSVVFTYEISITGILTLTVYTEDIIFSGDCSIYFVFYYSLQPSIFVQSNVFIVTIVNPCLPPPGCINIPGCGIPPTTVNPPSIDISIDITVTVDVTIELPPWNCGNPGCNTQIIPTCVDCNIGGGAVVVIVDTNISISITDCTNICGDTSDGVVHVIVIQGCLGTTCIDVDVDIVVYNPCFDPNYYYIQPVPMPQIQYVLYSTTQYTLQYFNVVGT